MSKIKIDGCTVEITQDEKIAIRAILSGGGVVYNVKFDGHTPGVISMGARSKGDHLLVSNVFFDEVGFGSANPCLVIS